MDQFSYGACKKNQNLKAFFPVHDGCLEFSNPGGGISCEGCGCHRNYHEQVSVCALKVELAASESSASNSASGSMSLVASTSGGMGGEEREYVSIDLTSKRDNEDIEVMRPQEIKFSDLHAVHHENTFQEQLPFGMGAVLVKEEGENALVVEGGNEEISAPKRMRTSFEALQKQHPESCLELAYHSNRWKVLCGVCNRYLLADKTGNSLHNIENQHFTTRKHKLNIQAKIAKEG